MVKESTKERVIEVAKYMIETEKTLREIGEDLGWNKSTIHSDLRYRLPSIDPQLAKQVHNILEQHKATRHINGGKKTKEKWELLRRD